jgi:hypothetical protein
MKWFRFYSEVLHDSKVQTLSPELFRAWVNLLCLANEGTERGRLPDLRQIAFALRVKEEKAAQLVGQLTACGLIDADEEGGNRPHNWDKRQRDSDDVSIRVREYRKRKTRVSVTPQVTLHETNGKRDGNALEESRREEKTPLPPKGGDDDDENASLETLEDPKTLRSQRRSRITAERLEALVSWSREVIGDRGDVECYFSKLAGWAASYPIGWIETAVLCTAAKTDIRDGGLAQYTNKCLTNWHPDGPPKDMTRVAERQRAERPARPTEFKTAPPGFAEHIAGKGNKGTA